MFEVAKSTPLIWSEEDLQFFTMDGELWARNLLIDRGVKPYDRNNVVDFKELTQ